VSGLQAAATRWDGRRPPCPPPCAADLRRERERAGGGRREEAEASFGCWCINSTGERNHGWVRVKPRSPPNPQLVGF
jgi:hypothetical protein